MITVTIRIGGGLGGFDRVEPKLYIIEDNKTLAELLKFISKEIGESVIEETILVAVNGYSVRKQNRALTYLKNGDVISIVKAIAGG